MKTAFKTDAETLLREKCERLEASNKVLREALEAVAEDVCSFCCPSTWKTSDGPPPHSEKCKAITAALAEAGRE